MQKRIFILFGFLYLLYLVYLSNYHKSPAFENIIKDLGIEKQGESSGVAWTDYDGDGDLDLLIVGGTDYTKLFRNESGAKFTDVTVEAFGGQLTQESVFAGVFGDFDNDGCPDLYVTRTSASTEPGLPDILYRNNCNGTFTNVIQKAGIKDSYHGRAAAWADYNGDGYLDIYVANYGVLRETEYIHEPNILYENSRDGTFSNVTARAGVVGAPDCTGIRVAEKKFAKNVGGERKLSFQPIWFDYNNDNFIDLFVTNDVGVSVLYKNNGNGTFIDVTKEANLCVFGTGMGVTVGDYDNDGDLDFYVTNVGANYFWRNNGDGTFSEIAAEIKVADHRSLGWGTVFFDFDNDGDLDLYVVNGRVINKVPDDPEIGEIRLDKLFQNDGSGRFYDVTEKVGIFGDDAKEAAALADYNQDGFMDILVASSYLEREGKHRLYKNKGNRNRWLTIKLVGKYSNREGVGAKIVVKTGSKKQLKQVISGSSFISQDSLWQTFGLGISKTAEEITVYWPSGIVQNLYDVKSNQKITITESKN